MAIHALVDGFAYYAHHILFENGKRELLTEAIRYQDTYTYQNNQWLFVDRKLIINWEDKRLSTP